MVKFIPLTCEKCGGDLSVKEGLRFVTCNHCQTKFQVVQEKNTTFLEGIDVNITVNTPTTETCEIFWKYNKGTFLGFNDTFLYFAKAAGRDGIYTAAKGPELPGNKDGPNSSADHKDAFNCLKFVLAKSGWVETGQGSLWFNYRFSRSVFESSKESSLLKKEAEFGQAVLSFIGNNSHWGIGNKLIDAGFLEKSKKLHSRYTVLKAIYSLNQQQLKKIWGDNKHWKNADYRDKANSVIKLKGQLDLLKNAA